MKDRLGNRMIALQTREYATREQGDRFALVHDRSESERERGQPFDLALKRYARIGCQFDLPLFRYRDQLDFAAVTFENGTWAGRPCRVATVTNLGGGAYLGCGTMLGFTSWSYVHHIAPSQGGDLHRPGPQRAGPRNARERAGPEDVRDRLRRPCRGRAWPVGTPIDPDRFKRLFHLRISISDRCRHALDARRGRLLVQAGGQEPRRRRGRAGRRRPGTTRRELAAGRGDAGALRRRRRAGPAGGCRCCSLRARPPDPERPVRDPGDDGGPVGGGRLRVDRRPGCAGHRAGRLPGREATAAVRADDQAGGEQRREAWLGVAPRIGGVAGRPVGGGDDAGMRTRHVCRCAWSRSVGARRLPSTSPTPSKARSRDTGTSSRGRPTRVPGGSGSTGPTRARPG